MGKLGNMHYITTRNYGNTKRQSNSTDMALGTVKDIAKDVTSILQKINRPFELLLIVFFFSSY